LSLRYYLLIVVCRYVDEIDSVDDLERYASPPFMCLVEQWKGEHAGDISVGMVTICPSTGDVVWDDFDGRHLYHGKKIIGHKAFADTLMRIELEVSRIHVH
jgi:DNA mismatch repair protein MSH3